MTKITKNFITFVITVVMFAAMTTNAFAIICPGIPGYGKGGSNNVLVASYVQSYMWETCFSPAHMSIVLSVPANASLGRAFDINDFTHTPIAYMDNANALGMAQTIYHAIHAEECGYDCSGDICSVSKKYNAIRYNPEHFGNVLDYADAIEAEFGDEIDRADAAMIIYRAAKAAGFNGHNDPTGAHNDMGELFSDIDTLTEEYQTAVRFVMNNGLMDWPLEKEFIQLARHERYNSQCNGRLCVPDWRNGFHPYDAFTADQMMASSMYLYNILNGEGYDARTMEYSPDNFVKGFYLGVQTEFDADAYKWK